MSHTSIDFLDLTISKDFRISENKFVYTVFKKKDQKLQYLNHSSMHPPKILQAIPNSVFHRLYSLTSFSEGQQASKLFPEYFGALKNAKLIKNNFKYKPHVKSNRHESRKDSRKIYFVLGWNSPWWKRPPAKILNEYLKKFNLKFRITLSYSNMSNLESRIKADATFKLNADYEDRNFEVRL